MAETLSHDLVALRTRYRNAGRMLEARAVQTCIAIARKHNPDQPDQATLADRSLAGTVGAAVPDRASCGL